MSDDKLPWEEPADKPKEEVTIKFGKGLVGDPFLSKNGKELVEISIPNQTGDTRPWERFIISSKMVHENKFGKGMWMKLPADGTVTLSRPVKKGQDENGRNIWGKEKREVSNRDLKSMLEAYKEKAKNSVIDDLSGKRSGMTAGSKSTKKQDMSL